MYRCLDAAGILFTETIFYDIPLLLVLYIYYQANYLSAIVSIVLLLDYLSSLLAVGKSSC
jgi:hypothetical protein